jgi:predicted nucleic acid-binding protein
MGRAIDSNVLVRYFTQDNDELLAKATKLLASASTNSIVLDRIIIAELGYVLRSVYELKKDQIVQVYKSMLANDIFSIPDRELVEMTVELFDSEKPLSFEDCWLLALKRSKKITTILTLDNGLLND